MAFDLQAAAWFMDVIETGGLLPGRADPERFLSDLASNLSNRSELLYRSRPVASLVSSVLQARPLTIAEKLRRIARACERLPWIALMVPPLGVEGGSLSDPQYVHGVLNGQQMPGLLLQLDGSPSYEFPLYDVPNALRPALSQTGLWPGIAVSNRFGQAAFLPLYGNRELGFEPTNEVALRFLARCVGGDIYSVEHQFYSELPRRLRLRQGMVTLLHLSDLHFGRRGARIGPQEVIALTREVLAEGSGRGMCVPLVTGDITDDPSPGNWEEADAFLEALSQCVGHDAVYTYGNHDSRGRGVGLRFGRRHVPRRTASRFWDPSRRFGVYTLDSADGLFLAQGMVRPREFARVRRELQNDGARPGDTVLVAMHHHLLPVPVPPPFAAHGFYRFLRELGHVVAEPWLELANGADVVRFAEDHDVFAVLHGHKHVPFWDEHPLNGLPVSGCGSTTGHVWTVDGRPYLSLNLVSFTPVPKRVVFRHLFQRHDPRTRIAERERHEYIHVVAPRTAPAPNDVS